MLGYCSLADAKLEKKATETFDDDKIMRFVNQISRRIDWKMSKYAQYAAFGPNIATIKFPLSGRYIDSSMNTLSLRRALPLLSITSAAIDTTSITTVLEGYPQGEPYFRQVRINSSGDNWFSYCESDDPSYLSITGVWGYHRDYANAWLSVGSLVAGIAADATSFTIADIDGDDAYGFQDKISRGHLLRFGTGSDYALVVDTNTTTNTGTIQRNVQGGTGAVQALGTTIYRWEVEEPMRRAVSRQAALMYARMGAFQIETIDGVGTVSYPQDLMPEIKHILTEYINS
jgi:hypothetical protein